MSDDQEQEGTGRVGTVKDWTAGPIIAEYPSGTVGGYWYPAIEVYVNERAPDGQWWVQKFIIHDGTPDRRFPVDQVGPNRIPFDDYDRKGLRDLWATLNKGA